MRSATRWRRLGWRVTYVERKGDRWYELPGGSRLRALADGPLRPAPRSGAREHDRVDPQLDRALAGAAVVRARRRAAGLLAGLGRADRSSAPAGARSASRWPSTRRASTPGRPSARFVCRLRVHRQLVGQGSRHPARARAARGASASLVYGKDWEQVPELAPYARGELPYEELPLLYPSAKLVLDDTQGPTLPYGAVNARVFDALAAGTLVITNCESGVRELFDEEFPVWSSRERPARGARRAAGRRRPPRGARGALPRDGAHAPHLRPPRRAAARDLDRARAAAELLPEDRRPQPRGRAHLGRPALRRVARARAAPPRAPHADPDARRVGGRGRAELRRRHPPQGPLALSPQAGPVQRAVVDQPSRRADRRGVRRLRPRRGRLAAVRRAACGSAPPRR